MSDDAAFGTHGRICGGHVDFKIRATDRAAFDAEGLRSGMLTKDRNGRVVAAAGMHITHLGAVRRRDGSFDQRHHVNLRVNASRIGSDTCRAMLASWKENGQLETDTNDAAAALLHAGVSIIDPGAVRTPVRVWL